MTTVFTVVGVKKLIYQTLEEDYGVLPNGGGSLGGGAGGGLNQTQVEAIVNAAVANLTASGGLTQADVDAAIATAIAAIVPCQMDANAVNALIAAALAGLPPGLDAAAVNALIEASQLFTALGAIQGDVFTAMADIMALKAALAGLPAADVQPLLDLLGLKAGATVDDVAVVWQALSDQSVSYAQLLSLLSGKPLSANPTVADVQAGLPVLIDTIAKAAIDGSCEAGAIAATVNNLYNLLYNDDIVPLKDAVRLGFPHQQGQLDTLKTDLQALLNILGRVDAANINNVNTSMTAAFEGLFNLDASLAGAWGAIEALQALGVGGGDGTGLTAEQAQVILDSAADLAALKVENEALKTRLAELETKFNGLESGVNDWAQSISDRFDNQTQTMADIVEYVIEQDQATLDAMNGPHATVESVMQMFWLLNDIITALIEATGVEIPGKV